MSVRKLTNQIHQLQLNPSIDANDIQELREAAGSKVSRTEQLLMDEFIQEHVSSFSSEAVFELQSKFEMKLPSSAKLSLYEKQKLDIGEASGITILQDGRSLIVDDEKGIFLQGTNGSTEMLASSKDFKGLKGLEGICVSTDEKQMFVVSEDTRRVLSFDLDTKQNPPGLSKPKQLGKLPKIGIATNKGWEGLSFMPAKHSPTGSDCLVAVHEGSPQAVGFFSVPELETLHIIELSKSMRHHLKDLSDLTICPETGNLFLLSDESSKIAECKLQVSHLAGPGALLSSVQLKVLGSTEIPKGKSSKPNRKPEGIAFRPDKTLAVVTEGDRSLLFFDVNREEN